MDDRVFDGALRRWATAVSRRGLVAGGLAGLAAGLLGRAPTGAAKRCKRRLAACTRKRDCCGRGVRCATSHGAGSNTCCGGLGARCTSTFGCCTPYLCMDGRCQQ